MKVVAIIACAGKGARARQSQNKIFSKRFGVPVIYETVSKFASVKKIDEIIIIHAEGEDVIIKDILKGIDTPIRYVLGGETRFISVKNALSTLGGDEAVLIHDGARPDVSVLDISACIKTVLSSGTAVLAKRPVDTVMTTDGKDAIFSSSRKDKLLALTPQCFIASNIKNAYAHASEDDGFTDDAGVYTAFIGKCKAVITESDNKKLTYPEDFCQTSATRCGTGFDLHKLDYGRKLVLGGVNISHEKGLVGHSDADVLTHAVMDALLSSASLQDIGYHFSDKDPAYKDADSMVLLEKVIKMLKEKGLKPLYLSAVVMAEKPKLSPYREVITKSLANALSLPVSSVGITFTTLEGIGTVGREEGIASQAFVLVKGE
ncbi:MAG: 2-C-methyl-D-erythritol 2,4-cyclodiphosphate synthase [Clostridia bacterium]|nr:2-C-methyl-D-erythritol 2,4-cyclodiphosphate synthase [Clostridia bacterium]